MNSGDFVVENAFLDGLGLLPLCVPENDVARTTFIKHCYLTLTPEALVRHFTTALHYKAVIPSLTDEQHAREFGQVLAPLLADSVRANRYDLYATAERLLLKSLAKRSPAQGQADQFYVGKALEFLRAGSGIPLNDAQKRTGVPIERIEAGHLAASPAQLDLILNAYSMPKLTPADLTQLGRDVWERMGLNTSSVELVPQNAYQAIKIHCYNRGWSSHDLADQLGRVGPDDWNLHRRILIMQQDTGKPPPRITRATERQANERRSLLGHIMRACGYEQEQAFLADGIVLSRKLTSGNVINAINVLADNEARDSALKEVLGPDRLDLIRQKRVVLRTEHVAAVLKATGHATLSDLVDAAKTLPASSQIRVDSKDQKGGARDR